jgi:hypothetical protein
VQGYDLVALIFAREVNDPLTGLVKKLDKQLEDAGRRHGPNKLGIFVIFCTDVPGFGRRLPDLIAKEKLNHVVLSTHNAAGPPKYRVAKEADLTVVVYQNRNNVKSNFALRKGELSESKCKEILAAVSQVLPK